MTNDYTFNDEPLFALPLKNLIPEKIIRENNATATGAAKVPSAPVIQNLMAYSRALAVLRTCHSGFFNMVLN
ncbi:MAG: hypothetical protein JXA03_16150 [Bacteroidales bacterium]|nr:hypothetical protein [Bacteroidales bacterium]